MILWVTVIIGALIAVINCNSPTVDYRLRIDCHPEPGATEKICLQRDCIWDNNTYEDVENVAACYFPATTGLFVVSATKDKPEWILIKELYPKVENNPSCPYGSDIQLIRFTATSYGNALNIRIEPRDQSPKRYEPDIRMTPTEINSSHSFELITNDDRTDEVFKFKVVRKETGTAVWDTSIGGFIFADQFIQIATKLPSDKLYGFGENTHQTLKHDFSKYKTWGMLARDEGPNSAKEDTKNLYGVHPFYLLIEEDGNAHGVFILNSNAQEVTTGPGPHLIYRTIGGILNIFFFPGPTPREVIEQYLAFIGTPFLPPYWGLGFQLSKYGYKDLNEVKEIIKENLDNNVPLEIVYADIDYMENCTDFTTGPGWEGLGEYAKELHDKNMKMILIFDPAIDVTSEPFIRAIDTNASFIEYPTKELAANSPTELYSTTNETKIMLSVVWPYHHTAFPDFFDPENITQNWWSQELSSYHEKVPYDGIWIDMNEPAAFGTNEEEPWYNGDPNREELKPLFCNNFAGEDAIYDDPPYRTYSAYGYGAEVLPSAKTLCMLGRTHRGKQIFYNTKNLYGLYETIATYNAAKSMSMERPLIISRSTFPSSGRYAGHWLGDNTASWNDLKTTIIGVMEFNMFGIPYVGSDVCGFNNESTEELCLRWQQVGAFHPFFRNHNNNASPREDPAHWPNVAAATRKANLFRYSYLSYLYSLHFEASLYGRTVVRPLFFEFVSNKNTHNISDEFMWGDSILIAPVTEQGKECIPVYLPPESKWYSLRSDDYGIRMGTSDCLSATIYQLLPVFIRGGKIIPRQIGKMTTTATRQTPITLIIASDVNGYEKSASGNYYWDDDGPLDDNLTNHKYCNVKTDFSCQNRHCQITINTICTDDILSMPAINCIEIFGYIDKVLDNTLKIDDKSDVQGLQLSYGVSNILIINGTELFTLSDKQRKIVWDEENRIPTTTISTTAIATTKTTDDTTHSIASTNPPIITTTKSLTTTTTTTSGSFSTLTEHYITFFVGLSAFVTFIIHKRL